jgi:hypothetical protein
MQNLNAIVFRKNSTLSYAYRRLTHNHKLLLLGKFELKAIEPPRLGGQPALRCVTIRSAASQARCVVARESRARRYDPAAGTWLPCASKNRIGRSFISQGQNGAFLPSAIFCTRRANAVLQKIVFPPKQPSVVNSSLRMFR